MLSPMELHELGPSGLRGFRQGGVVGSGGPGSVSVGTSLL